ncbi:MAG: hypothetical protein R2824_25390 [Saprospiraceae bacterium]|nr:PD40 domain-containing protein [Lewinella sp.]
MKRYLFLLFLFGCSMPLSAQTMEQFIEDAEKQHENENYYGAYDSYRIATEFDESRMDLWYHQGENARLYTAYETALGAYQQVLQHADISEFPELHLRMGQVHQFLGNYEEAVGHYRQFLSQGNISEANRALADKNLTDSEWAAGRLQDADPIQVTHLNPDINTKYSDFALRRRGAFSYYTSNRIPFENDKLYPIRYLSRIFRIPNGDTLSAEVTIPNVGQDSIHTAHTAFNTEGTRVYYSICEYVGDTESVRCDLHFSTFGSNGEWGPPTRMSINVPGANNTQPHVAPDPDTGADMLYFVSDRTGGKGGLDIYRATLLEDGTAADIVNLEDINTAGDDVTPYYDSRTCRLYFSTDGRKTLGGFDIYYAPVVGDGFGEPVHLNSPVNGSFHDRYYVIAREDQKAYFSSNRQEASIQWTADEAACCDDLYSVPFDETIILDVYTHRRLDSSDLDRSAVTLFRLNTGDKGEEIDARPPQDSNHFVFAVQPGNTYALEGNRIAFGPDSSRVDLTNSCDVPVDRRLRRDLFLPQSLFVNVFDEETREPLNGATVLLASSKESKDHPLVEEHKEDTNCFHFYMHLDQPLYVSADRRMYISRDTSFTIPEELVDRLGNYEIDIYLPKDSIEIDTIELFFDNDLPVPTSKWDRMTTTEVEYSKTNIDYQARIKDFLEDQVSKITDKNQKFTVQTQFEAFFENDVKGGLTRLEALADTLFNRLQNGGRYSMYIQGHASVRGNPAYNEDLSKRRIDSVKDFFREYKGGILAKYIQQKALIFTEDEFGSRAAKSKNDASIFGLGASRDRRVTITKIQAIN